MSDIKRFRFVSPGIFINEIDQSQLPALPARMGPIIIGRSNYGPGFRPVICNSFADYVETFGKPVPGGKNDDMWREGNTTAPTYAAYAAQAYLKNSNPVTFIRVLGSQHPNHSNTSLGAEAGWRTERTVKSSAGAGGAYGLFIIPSASVGAFAQTVNCIDTTGQNALAPADASFSIGIPTSAGGLGSATTITFLLDGSESTGGSGDNNQIMIGIDDGQTDAQIAALIIKAINATADDRVNFADEGLGQAGYDIGCTAKQGSSDTQITLTMDAMGVAGNVDTVLVSTSGLNIIDVDDFTGGINDIQGTLTGTLGAVWYLNKGTIELSGTVRGTEGLGASKIFVTGSSTLLASTDAGIWKVLIKDENKTLIKETGLSFDTKSEHYIRKVFNTNPTLVNGEVYSTTTNYWLGESFERAVLEQGSGSAQGDQWGFIAALNSSSFSYDDQRKEAIPSETGWIISQDLSNTFTTFDPEDNNRVKKLFKFVSIDGGSEWNQNNLKISLKDIRPGKDEKNWATFTVELRSIYDHDKVPKVVERYSNCNLNPNSVNYVGRKIGTREVIYDTTERRLISIGDYENKSRFVRVDTKEENYSREVIPFGAFGPPKYKDFILHSGSAHDTPDTQGEHRFIANNVYKPFIAAGRDSDATEFIAVTPAGAEITPAKALVAGMVYVGNEDFTGSFAFPAVSLRASGTNGAIVDQRKAYFGADTSRKTSSDVRYERSVGDILKTKPEQTAASALDFTDNDADNAEYSWIFTLDDIRKDSDGVFAYVSGSRQGGTSATAVSGAHWLLTASAAGISRFTTVLYGGFDGFDITEREPFNNTRALNNLKTESGTNASYALHSLHKALDVVSDPEMVEGNLLAMPGIINNEITNRMVNVCEERGDVLAIIDIPHGFTPTTENTKTNSENRGDVDEAAAALKDREIDSSYGCCYYPWVQIVDSFDSTMLWVPPSIVALGAMAYSEAVKEVWFAPAGFNRGGLTATNAGGVNVVGVNQQLSSKQRDTLYEVGINPIASFPAEGVVIFGQKTLQSVPSALDRINVRRLLIFLKKEISRIAATTLFEQNVESTWNAFRSQTETLLSSVKTRLGLMDYKVVLDESTTTPELIDRNILYAKVFLKPARAIEFIALDFFITRSGASFED